jgi:hypothetical protein
VRGPLADSHAQVDAVTAMAIFFDGGVDYAQLMKVFASELNTGRERYSPPVMVISTILPAMKPAIRPTTSHSMIPTISSLSRS